MRRATLGLALSCPRDPALQSLLTFLSRWCVVRQADAAELVDAWMVTDRTVQSLVSPGPPLLVWTKDAATAVSRWSGSAILVMPRLPAVLPHAGALSVPEPGVDATAAQFVPPVIRERWRRRLGLPHHTVIHVGGEGAAGLPPRLEPTALAIASVVVAAGDSVLRSMAWGAPTVTDPGTAARLDLGDAVRVASTTSLVRAARTLCEDDSAMSALAWRGRQLIEERFDLAGAAYRVAQTARILPVADLTGGVLTRLNELWASPATASSMIRAITV